MKYLLAIIDTAFMVTLAVAAFGFLYFDWRLTPFLLGLITIGAAIAWGMNASRHLGEL